MSSLLYMAIMEPKPKLIIDYITPDGKDVFNNWFMRLKDSHVKVVVRARIERIKLGNMGDCKPVGEGVSELRFSSGIRIYYAEIEKVVVLLLCGGNKSSQSKDILKAQGYLKEFKTRPEV